MGLILSVDVGTTNLKAALVDEESRIVGEACSIPMKIEGDTSGRAEHDPLALRENLLEVCKRAIADRGRDIEGISLTSYQFGLVLVDANGQPLTHISTFVDTKAQSHHPKFLKAIGNVDAMYLRTGCPPIFQYPSNRLHFLASREPDVVARTAHVLDSKAFLMHTLTGEYFTDYSTANSLGCLDVDGRWDKDIIRVTGFDVAQFPRVLDGFTGKVPLMDSVCNELGLKRGTQITAGLYDGAALAAALTAFEPEIGVGNFGTSGMFRVPTVAPVEDLEGGGIQSCLLTPGVFFTGSGINNCTIASNLLLNVLQKDMDYLKGSVLSVPGSHGVMTFPYFTGERDKIIGNVGTGVVFGLGVASSCDDLARSFLEGVAFSYRFVKQKLDPERRIREFRLGGGGTSNLAWMQIMADTLNLPIRLSHDPEAGIVGAANLARYGRSAALRESSQRLMQDARVIEPIPENVVIYDELAGRYFAVRQSLRTPLLARQGLVPLKTLKARPVRKEISLERKTKQAKK